MWKKLVNFLINLLPKRTYKSYTHICHSYTITYTAKSKYIYGGGSSKQGMKLRYSVWESSKCDECGKQIYRYKVATNVTSSLLSTKFGIKV